LVELVGRLTNLWADMGGMGEIRNFFQTWGKEKGSSKLQVMQAQGTIRKRKSTRKGESAQRERSERARGGARYTEDYTYFPR